MKIAIIGNRDIGNINLFEFINEYIDLNTLEIISGWAKGVDTYAKLFAKNNKIKYTEFLPKYNIYVRYAPLKRNLEIIDYAEFIIIFWNGKSRKTKFVIENCKKLNKPHKIFII